MTKEVEDLYTENDKTELKEMEENLTKWKVSPVGSVVKNCLKCRRCRR